jgi:hypothetical protein
MSFKKKPFDFDSLEPVQGEVYLWSKRKAELVENAIVWVKVFIVIVGGIKLMLLVYNGWYLYIIKGFATIAPEIYEMLTIGK